MSAPTTNAGRTLAVTGDDFGLTPGISRGIVHAHTHGVLTHASLMATAPFVAGAIDLARRTPSLAVGLHLVLADGRACLPAGQAPSLGDCYGRLRPTAGAFIRDWILGRIEANDIQRELRAQIELVLAAGVHPTHLDSHKHLHMWPPIFEIVVRLAREYHIPAVRVAVEQPAARLILENRRDRAARRQAASNVLMAPLGWLNRATLRMHGIEPLSFVGRAHTGLLTPDRLALTIARLPPGATELMTHPGFVDRHLLTVNTRLRTEREREVELLCAPATREAIERAGVHLAMGPEVPRCPGRVAMECAAVSDIAPEASDLRHQGRMVVCRRRAS